MHVTMNPIHDGRSFFGAARLLTELLARPGSSAEPLDLGAALRLHVSYRNVLLHTPDGDVCRMHGNAVEVMVESLHARYLPLLLPYMQQAAGPMAQQALAPFHAMRAAFEGGLVCETALGPHTSLVVEADSARIRSVDPATGAVAHDYALTDSQGLTLLAHVNAWTVALAPGPLGLREALEAGHDLPEVPLCLEAYVRVSPEAVVLHVVPTGQAYTLDPAAVVGMLHLLHDRMTLDGEHPEHASDALMPCESAAALARQQTVREGRPVGLQLGELPLYLTVDPQEHTMSLRHEFELDALSAQQAELLRSSGKRWPLDTRALMPLTSQLFMWMELYVERTEERGGL